MVIGGGIAGTSVAYELSKHGKVALLEQESTLGAHSTGRSAAIGSTNFESPAVRALGARSLDFFKAPPVGFTDTPLIGDLEILWLAGAHQLTKYQSMLGEVRRCGYAVDSISPRDAASVCPIVRESAVHSALLERDAYTLDVHAIHQGYVRAIRRAGGTVVTSVKIQQLKGGAACWTVLTEQGEYRASVVVNAAGGWCDQVAALAGVEPIGIQSLRRSIFTVDAPPSLSSAQKLPFVYDIEEQLYFKFEHQRILISPSEEVPCHPGQAHTDEFDIAVAADRFQQMTSVNVSRVRNSWAGTRNFAPDRELVVGEESAAPGFFWVAGQGGVGIMTAPAVAELTAELILMRPDSEWCRDLGLNARTLSPDRFRSNGVAANS